MRVELDSLESFLKHLGAKDLNCIYDKTIFYDQYRQGMDSPERSKATRFKVVFQASAVIRADDGDGEYVLALGMECENDRPAAPEEMKELRDTGTRQAAALQQQLEDYCTDRQLRLLPGRVEE